MNSHVFKSFNDVVLGLASAESAGHCAVTCAFVLDVIKVCGGADHMLRAGHALNLVFGCRRRQVVKLEGDNLARIRMPIRMLMFVIESLSRQSRRFHFKLL